ncbi:hypothetical protein HELRODRAFT_162840 [Helobdella robusta]|uniref:Uncharacterized protein n=1 Tax=Helobdella robusta TaxID=6412 RepID=T1ET90_HELRO|nr:hypothetical protein HELRODRAFT_162840 [Helobdella robusta]ESN99318.1 hypothetical protein HELRODRAFT_162840 [Helobdella robusta]
MHCELEGVFHIYDFAIGQDIISSPGPIELTSDEIIFLKSLRYRLLNFLDQQVTCSKFWQPRYVGEWSVWNENGQPSKKVGFETGYTEFLIDFKAENKLIGLIFSKQGSLGTAKNVDNVSTCSALGRRCHSITIISHILSSSASPSSAKEKTDLIVFRKPCTNVYMCIVPHLHDDNDKQAADNENVNLQKRTFNENRLCEMYG